MPEYVRRARCQQRPVARGQVIAFGGPPNDVAALARIVAEGFPPNSEWSAVRVRLAEPADRFLVVGPDTELVALGAAE